MKEKVNRLDESFTGKVLQKSFTGNVNQEIDLSQITISPSGIVQSTTTSTPNTTQNPGGSQTEKPKR